MKELYFLLGLGLGAAIIFCLNSGETNDQSKVDDLTKKIKDSREKLTKAVTDNTPKPVS